MAPVLQVVEPWGCFDRVVAAAIDANGLSSLTDMVCREHLHVGSFRGCLVVLWDLEAVASPGALEGFLDGLPEFTLPAYVDPDQQPRRNGYHRRE